MIEVIFLVCVKHDVHELTKFLPFLVGASVLAVLSVSGV